MNSRYANCLTSTNELIEMYRGFEAANISGTSCSYRNVTILPEAYEIARKPKVKLQANIIEGSYQNWSHYLHVQFSLLREDFISPLRKGICDYNRGYEDRSRQNIRVYKYVRILEPVCLYTGVGFQIQFDATYGHWRRIEWEHSRRLNFGSLLCLSSDKFATVLFATVVSRDPKLLKDGILKVQFENANVSKLLEISPETEFTMVESTAYFEAYRHILNRLQNLEENPPSFKLYIVDCKPLEYIPPPSYLKDIEDKQDVCFDLSALGYPHSVNVLNPQDWPDFDESSLDKSQLNAVRMALTQEMSVIQGPPGTGKTYIGLKIVEILLDNKSKWDPFLQSPILIVCYTNHALDQFLEGILKFNKEGESVNMVRVGGRCRSEAIQPYNLQVLVRQHKTDRRHCSMFEQKQLRRAKNTMDSKHQEITEKLHKVSALIANDKPIILELCDLEPVIFSEHVRQLETFAELCGIADGNKVVETWLLSGLNQNKSHHEGKAQLKHTNHKPSEAPMEVDGDDKLSDRLVDDMDGEADHLENDRIIDGEQIVLEPMVYKKEPFKHKTHPNRWPDNVSKQIRDGMKTKPLTKEEVRDIEDVTELSCTQKWALYQHWVNLFVQRCKRKATCHVESYAAACKEFQRARTELDYAVMHDAHVVGMTTTGAAKYHSILQKLRPKIIIIEEAAEVLESHVVTTLTVSTQQVIMIGDHQQLRPKPNDYHLATEYNLEVSLFERLTKNNFPYATLEVQHRMRPEIVQLICPHIYENLINAAEVHEYEEIKGIKHSLFFIDHTVAEDDNGKEMTSHSNEFEASFAVQLCCYFIKRGYYQHQITILTMYSGQVLKIKKMLRQFF